MSTVKGRTITWRPQPWQDADGGGGEPLSDSDSEEEDFPDDTTTPLGEYITQGETQTHLFIVRSWCSWCLCGPQTVSWLCCCFIFTNALMQGWTIWAKYLYFIVISSCVHVQIVITQHFSLDHGTTHRNIQQSPSYDRHNRQHSK